MSQAFGLIVAAGAIEDYSVHRAMLADLPAPRRVYCADGGLKHMERLGLAPDMILGDFDSADTARLVFLRVQGLPFERYPADKDYTDTELAVNRAVSDGCAAILIFGALGARIDHTFTNIQLMYKLALRGVRVLLADQYGIAAVLVSGGVMKISKNRPLASLLGSLTYKPAASAFASAAAAATASAPASERIFASPKLSILPIGGVAKGVWTSGLKYALRGDDLESCYTIGVSNEFTGRSAAVKIAEGAVLVMICADKQESV